MYISLCFLLLWVDLESTDLAGCVAGFPLKGFGEKSTSPSWWGWTNLRADNLAAYSLFYSSSVRTLPFTLWAKR